MFKVTAVILALIALTACGSSGKPSSPASSAYAKAVRTADCMRSHGVPNYPDPSANGPYETPISSSPAFQAAMKTCGIFAPGAGGGLGPPSEQHRLLAVAFAKCMRKHGLPGFPDPTTTPPPATPGADTYIGRDGMIFALGPGLTFQSPQFQQAADACGLHVPKPSPAQAGQ
jgi:predicted small lipoprotein YifL